MELLLVCPSFPDGAGSSFFPLGLASIASCARQAGHRVSTLNFNILPPAERLPTLRRMLQERRFDVVGAGGMSMVIDSAERIVQTTRELAPWAKVVLGGGLISADPLEMVNLLKPDFGVVEEGEVTLVELLEFLQTGREDFARVDGLVWWEGETPRQNATRAAIPDLDALPPPDFDGFGMAQFLDAMSDDFHDHHLTMYGLGRAMPMVASRSCPYRCTFCFHPTSRVYRKRRIENVVDDIARYRDHYRTNVFGIYDELFDEDPERIRRFCQLLTERNLDIQWCCSLRVNRVDGALLKLMRASGCFQISYGFESASPRVLRSMKKGIRPEQIAKAVQLTREAGICIQANFLYGDPAETLETLQETLDFQERHQLYFVDFSAVIPYPGSPLYHKAKQEGRIGEVGAFTRSLSPLDRYLWNPDKAAINFTALPDGLYWEKYLELRELNDANHRKRGARFVAGRVVGPAQSVLRLRCQWCEDEGEYPVVHPPGSDPEAVPDPNRAFVGVRGINLMCHRCRRKMHLPVWEIPHMAPLWDHFAQVVQRLTREQTPVVLLPAIDRHFRTVSDRVDLSGLNVRLVMDPRRPWWGQRFLGCVAQPFDAETLRQALGDDGRVLLLPAYDAASLRRELDRVGVAAHRIDDWRDGLARPLASEDGAQPGRGVRRA
ncbi:MAG: B12-binding domain-containing radical SAM protein [Magnetococcales bacterium]|nr:B12-binding domain-containing radical SAM protein [Magnetococcales bacterium]